MNKFYTHYDQLPIVLNADQLAQALGISRANAYQLMHSKGFPTIRIGKRMLVPKDKFLEWFGSGLHPDSECCGLWQPDNRCSEGSSRWPNSDTRRTYNQRQASSGASWVHRLCKFPSQFPMPCRFWDWFLCSPVRCTKRRKPSESECNCLSNCPTNHPHASSESSCRDVLRLLERC